MKIDLDEFFDSTPTLIDIAIAIVLIAVGLGFGLAIGNSNKLEVTREGIKIGQKAIAKDLEWAFTIIQIQDGLITRQEQEVRDFSITI